MHPKPEHFNAQYRSQRAAGERYTLTLERHDHSNINCRAWFEGQAASVIGYATHILTEEYLCLRSRQIRLLANFD
ncbi:hypothetical protein BKP42_68150 [Rhodococcus erythropolis]|nr:hypothetical protein BKP42_68150 [Rhodococcus erythropolis]